MVPGLSETAFAAAATNWFDGPTTKLSKVYFGLNDDDSMCGFFSATIVGWGSSTICSSLVWFAITNSTFVIEEWALLQAVAILVL